MYLKWFSLSLTPHSPSVGASSPFPRFMPRMKPGIGADFTLASGCGIFGPQTTVSWGGAMHDAARTTGPASINQANFMGAKPFAAVTITASAVTIQAPFQSMPGQHEAHAPAPAGPVQVQVSLWL